MSEYEDSRQRYEKTIEQAKVEAFRRRAAVREELPSPSVETKRRLAEALANYRDQLVDHRGDTSLKEPWDDREPDVDIVDDLLEQTVKVTSSSDWAGRAKQQSVPAVAKLDAKHLIEIGKELDAIAKELGFGANTRDTTPEDEADLGDLRALLKSRGQTEALKNLPGSGSESVGDSVEVDS